MLLHRTWRFASARIRRKNGWRAFWQTVASPFHVGPEDAYIRSNTILRTGFQLTQHTTGNVWNRRRKRLTSHPWTATRAVSQIWSTWYTVITASFNDVQTTQGSKHCSIPINHINQLQKTLCTPRVLHKFGHLRLRVKICICGLKNAFSFYALLVFEKLAVSHAQINVFALLKDKLYIAVADVNANLQICLKNSFLPCTAVCSDNTDLHLV